jgi:hypothetical protein
VQGRDSVTFLMTKSLDPFRFLLIALSGWMNQQQLQLIDYLLGREPSAARRIGREQAMLLRLLRKSVSTSRIRRGSAQRFSAHSRHKSRLIC